MHFAEEEGFGDLPALVASVASASESPGRYCKDGSCWLKSAENSGVMGVEARVGMVW